MRYEDAIRHFGTQVKLAEALGIAQPTVSCWNRVIPAAYQYQLEVITDGKLEVDPDLRLPRSNNHEAETASQ